MTVFHVCCGSHDLMHYIENKLKVKIGETTQDGLFTLEEVERIAACTKAPVIIVNGKDYYENMNIETVNKLLEKLENEAKKMSKTAPKI